MWCKTTQADRGHQSEQLLPRSFYLFPAYKKVAKKHLLCFVELLNKFTNFISCANKKFFNML